MWPHHPRNQLLLEVARTELGALRFSHGAFSFPLDRPNDHRFDERGGGALFDVGIYCLGPALLVAPREPRCVAATAVRNVHGVDVSLSGWLDLGEGFAATCEVSFESVSGRSYILSGTNGQITIPDWFAPGPAHDSTVDVLQLDGSVLSLPAAGADAYGEMLDQFARVVQHDAAPRWGDKESRLLARWIEALHHASA